MPTKKKSKPKTISAEDLYRFEFITDMRISPGGDHVAYSVQRVDKTTEKKYMNLWIVPSKGGKPKQFTYGDHVDCHPRWSPDGKEIFFISNRGSETQSQIYIIPLDGGEGRQLTNLTGTIGGFNLSNDGKKLVMEFRKKDKEQLERDKDDQKKKLGVVARHYTNLWFKLDGEGYLPDEKWHLWTVDTKSGKAMQITDDQKFEEYNSSFSPDGKKIVFY
ncbi:MAG: DPP IV N-terminal domain-containing protein, partial [bacterium]